MSAHARSSDRAPPAPRTTRTGIPCDPCPSFWTAPVLIFVRPNDDVGLTASDDVSHFIPCRPHAEVAVRHVECSCRRNRHPVQSVVLSDRDPHRFLTVPVQCLLRGDSNCAYLWRRLPEDPSRNVLFSGARLLVSGFTWFPLRCDPPSAVWRRRARVTPTLICTVSPHRDIATSM